MPTASALPVMTAGRRAWLRVPWWGVLSSAAAPVLLIGGWTAAAALQPGHFDAVTGTISALAARGATDRWVMTAALAGLGSCHLITGLALRPASWPGRLLLMTGGAATIAVAANPLPAGGGSSLQHGLAAAAGFIALAIWPACAWRRPDPVPVSPARPALALPGQDPGGPDAGSPVPAGLRPVVSIAAALGLLGLLGWFAAQLWGGGQMIGLTERVVAGAEAIWPLAVVLTARRGTPQAHIARS